MTPSTAPSSSFSSLATLFDTYCKEYLESTFFYSMIIQRLPADSLQRAKKFCLLSSGFYCLYGKYYEDHRIDHFQPYLCRDDERESILHQCTALLQNPRMDQWAPLTLHRGSHNLSDCHSCSHRVWNVLSLLSVETNSMNMQTTSVVME